MSYTIEDFKHDYIKKHLPQLTPEERRELLQSLPLKERREVLQSLPPEELLAALSAEQIRQHLDQRTAAHPVESRKPRRKR